jgi:hypothetical protein
MVYKPQMPDFPDSIYLTIGELEDCERKLVQGLRDHGYFVSVLPARDVVEVEERASMMLGETMRRNFVEETEYCVRTRTYQDRAIFDMPPHLIPLKNGVVQEHRAHQSMS